jgi:radical SAM superfamily enzyme YgiQ (UPF0313 family)
LLSGIYNGQAVLNSSLPIQLLDRLETASLFDKDRRKTERVQYQNIYLPVGILPPDQYGAVVLQATQGCSFNTCTFCSFYKDTPFRISKPAEFHLHCEAVKDFLGRGLNLRRTIFLGDANALVIPMKILVPLMEIMHRYFDIEALGGIYAFLDGASGEHKSSADYSRLAKMGLKRVYIGLESGSTSLLKFLQKTWHPR